MKTRNERRILTKGLVYVALAGVLMLKPARIALPAFAQGTVTVPRQLPGQVTNIGQPFSTGPGVHVIPAQTPLRGWVDLHAHPLSNLGFGGKLVYGGPDVGSLLPADPGCNHNVQAASEAQALGHDNSTHGGWGIDNGCGDYIRSGVIHGLQQGLGASDPPDDSSGYPAFPNWPAWNDLTHQRMWVDWIRRAYQGGQRVMVALAVNNKTLGDMTAGPGDYPTDDKSSADFQIAAIKAFVARHSDFMAVAESSNDVYQIVSANKMAVVIGTEIDHIGNLQSTENPVVPTAPAVVAEIDRLYNEGVRYIFPIHLLDNAFGGTAAYVNLFNVSNVRESGHPYELTCAAPSEHISYIYNNNDLGFQTIVAQMLKKGWGVTSINYPGCPSGYGQKNSLGLTANGIVAMKEMMRLGMLIDIDHMSEASADQALQIACYGNVRSASSPFMFTLGCPFGYPVNSGHNGPREAGGNSERSLRADQYAVIAFMHGMAGVGSAKLTADQWLQLYGAVMKDMQGDPTYSKPYNPNAPFSIGGESSGVAAGFGTDMDGLEFAMPPRQGLGRVVYGPNYSKFAACMRGPTCRQVPVNPNPGGEPNAVRPGSGPINKPNTTTVNSCMATCEKEFPNAEQYVWTIPPPNVQYSASFPQPADGNKTWNYNTDGVAHYGMLADFLKDVASLPGGAAMVNNNFMYGADYFYRTWQRAEALSKNAPR